MGRKIFILLFISNEGYIFNIDVASGKHPPLILEVSEYGGGTEKLMAGRSRPAAEAIAGVDQKAGQPVF